MKIMSEEAIKKKAKMYWYLVGVCGVVILAFWLSIGYVAIHFIIKFW